MQVEVTTWYLHMLGPAELRAAPCPSPSASLARAEVASPELSRFLYTAVGGPWYWLDRLDWDYARWMAYLDRPEVETWVAYASGTPAGYIELEAQPDDNVEIAYFGLLPGFMGQRLGAYLLSAGVARAWAFPGQQTRRVWVHTCSLDGPHALANYEARGFQRYDQRSASVDVPERSPGPWPGAGV